MFPEFGRAHTTFINCGNIFVLIIVLYCIMIATVSHLIHPVRGMASHMTHCAMWLLSQAACLYSSLISCSTLLLMSTYKSPCAITPGLQNCLLDSESDDNILHITNLVYVNFYSVRLDRFTQHCVLHMSDSERCL